MPTEAKLPIEARLLVDSLRSYNAVLDQMADQSPTGRQTHAILLLVEAVQHMTERLDAAIEGAALRLP